jgi:hypothetical protein
MTRANKILDNEKGKNLFGRRPRTCFMKAPIQEALHYFTKAKKESQAIANFYHSRSPNPIKEEVDQMEVAIKEKKKKNPMSKFKRNLKGGFKTWGSRE